MRQFAELTAAHECVCEKSWAGLHFDAAKLQADGSVALTHQCESHGKGQCTHILNTATVKLVQNALKGK
jgi:hypothetical protein